MNTLFVDPGRLRTELALEEAVTASDGAGGGTETWVEVATVFAAIAPQRAESRIGGDQRLETTSHLVTLRFRDAVRSGMRFRRGPRVLEILTVHDPDETGRYLVCRVREDGR